MSEINIDVLMTTIHEQAKAISELNEEIKNNIEEFLADLELLKFWAKEHINDAYDPIGSLIDDIDDTLIKKWVEKKDG